MEIDISLLELIDTRLDKEDMEYRLRPWAAISKMSIDHDVSIAVPSEEAGVVFDWFKKKAIKHAEQKPAVHQGLFFFEDRFWPVEASLIYSSLRLNPLDAIKSMPEEHKSELLSDNRAMWGYVIFWADFIDFGYAYDELQKSRSYSEFGLQFLSAGYEELSAAVSLLLDGEDGDLAIMRCRTAAEMFFKGFIAFKSGMSAAESLKLGHNLLSLCDSVVACSDYKHLDGLSSMLDVFPNINAKPEAGSIQSAEAFAAFSVAQSAGALIAREFTDRDVLEQLKP